MQKKIFAGYRPLLTDCVRRNVLLLSPKRKKYFGAKYLNGLKTGKERRQSKNKK